jgi:hypothetical protein
MAREVYLTDRQVRVGRLLAKISKSGQGKYIFPVCVRETAGKQRFPLLLDLEFAFALC